MLRWFLSIALVISSQLNAVGIISMIDMKASDKAYNTIKSFEGLCLSSYNCPAEVMTIGYGHTMHVEPNQTITEQQAETYLKEDVGKCEEFINKVVNTELTQNQYDALVSFVFNVGVGNFKNSTLLKKVNAGDFQGAGEEFKKWTLGKGKPLPGLVKRRNIERELFNS